MTPDPAVKFIQVGKIRLAYREWGEANRPALVLFHGMAETSAFFWQPLTARLSANYHILAFDLVGHGDSTRAWFGYTLPYQSRLYRAALSALGFSSYVLMGHSVGGIIAAQMALDCPAQTAGLILYDTPIPGGIFGNYRSFLNMSPFVPLSLLPLLLPFSGLVFDLLPKRLILRTTLRTWRVPLAPQNMTPAFLNQAVRHSGIALEQMLRFLFLFCDLERHLSALETPTLLLMGERDTLLSKRRAQQILAQFPHAELEVITQAGHLALIDQPAVFSDHVQRFLEK